MNDTVKNKTGIYDNYRHIDPGTKGIVIGLSKSKALVSFEISAETHQMALVSQNDLEKIK